MRQVILAAFLGLAACGSADSELKRLFSVDSLAATCAGGVLSITADVSANTGGWGEPVLRRLGTENGVLSFEAVAAPPKGDAATMMMQVFTVKHEEREPGEAATLRVVASQNEMSAPIGCAGGN